MQTALVAGGAGFIGSHLCKDLLEKGYKVIAVDNYITGDAKNVEALKANPNFSLIEKNIIENIDPNEFGKIDFIFHLASPASPNKKSKRSYINFPLETLLVNSQGTHNLLELAKVNNARFLYASTSEVYGDPAISPQTEDYFGNVNPNGIRSPYDESKRFGEALVMTYYRKFGLDIKIIRIFNTYGPNMQPDDGRVVSDFINKAIKNEDIVVFGKGDQTRSFCFISDLINGLTMAMFSDMTNGEVLNLGNPDERTILELAKLVLKLTNSDSKIIFEPLPEDDPKKRKPDISKAQRLFGWAPKIDVETGLTKTIEYFRSL